jgi:RecA/RadA recombinase
MLYNSIVATDKPTKLYISDKFDECTGGLYTKSIMEFYGVPSSGKTSICLWIAGKLQKANKNVIFFDTEASVHPKHADSLGFTMTLANYFDNLSSEFILTIIEHQVKQYRDIVFIIDSLTALSFEDEKNSPHHRLCTTFLKKVASLFKKYSNSSLIITNQIRRATNTLTASYGGTMLNSFIDSKILIEPTNSPNQYKLNVKKHAYTAIPKSKMMELL